MDEQISKEDMDIINAGKALAEKAAANARIADLEYRNAIQQIFIKYNMKFNDQINDITGKILRALPVIVPDPQQPERVLEEEVK